MVHVFLGAKWVKRLGTWSHDANICTLSCPRRLVDQGDTQRLCDTADLIG